MAHFVLFPVLVPIAAALAHGPGRHADRRCLLQQGIITVISAPALVAAAPLAPVGTVASEVSTKKMNAAQLKAPSEKPREVQQTQVTKSMAPQDRAVAQEARLLQAAEVRLAAARSELRGKAQTASKLRRENDERAYEKASREVKQLKRRVDKLAAERKKAKANLKNARESAAKVVEAKSDAAKRARLKAEVKASEAAKKTAEKEAKKAKLLAEKRDRAQEEAKQKAKLEVEKLQREQEKARKFRQERKQVLKSQ